jgi:ADP-ribose pyrophosphatase YjhB (NUDIX family)
MSFEALQVAVYRLLPRALGQRAVRLATPNFTVGSLGLITYDGAHVLMVRPTYRDGWMPPGGLLQRGETARGAVGREVREELGVEVDFAPYHRVALDPDRQVVTFVSVGVVPEGTCFEPRTPELSAARWFPLDALPALPSDFTEDVPPEDVEAIRAALRP